MWSIGVEAPPPREQQPHERHRDRDQRPGEFIGVGLQLVAEQRGFSAALRIACSSRGEPVSTRVVVEIERALALLALGSARGLLQGRRRALIGERSRRSSRTPRTSGRPRTGTAPSARRTAPARRRYSGGSARPAARRASAGSARSCPRNGARHAQDRARRRRASDGHAPPGRTDGNRRRCSARAAIEALPELVPRRCLAGGRLDRRREHTAGDRVADALRFPPIVTPCRTTHGRCVRRRRGAFAPWLGAMLARRP